MVTVTGSSAGAAGQPFEPSWMFLICVAAVLQRKFALSVDVEPLLCAGGLLVMAVRRDRQ